MVLVDIVAWSEFIVMNYYRVGKFCFVLKDEVSHTNDLHVRRIEPANTPTQIYP